MKVRIIARDWNKDLESRFGERGSIHELSDNAESFIRTINDRFIVDWECVPPELEIQNDYD